MTMRYKYWRLLVLAILLAGILLFLTVLPVREPIVRALEWARENRLFGAIFVASMYVPATVLCLPGSLITLGAGYALGVYWGTVAVSLGSVLGATAAFLTGRWLLQDFVQSRFRNYPLYSSIQEAVAEQGFRVVLLMRLSPVLPYNALNYILGLSRVRSWDYVLASWIGMFPATVMYVYFGSAAKSLTEVWSGQSEGGVASWTLFAVGLFATLMVTWLVTRRAKDALAKSLRQRQLLERDP